MTDPVRLRVGTYNVLDPGFGTLAPWDVRRENVARTIIGAECGILCLQETGLTPLAREIDLIGDLASLTRMTRCTTERDGVGFLYAAADWAAVRGGSFRLPRPFRDHNRSGVWQEFAHRSSGTRLLVVGTHFSPWPHHDAARVKHARALARRVRRINHDALPVVILGDFNSWTDRAPSTPMTALATKGYRDALTETGESIGTLMRRNDDRQFDHIAVSRGIAVAQTRVENPKLDGPASDHRLVWADLLLEL